MGVGAVSGVPQTFISPSILRSRAGRLCPSTRLLSPVLLPSVLVLLALPPFLSPPPPPFRTSLSISAAPAVSLISTTAGPHSLTLSFLPVSALPLFLAPPFLPPSENLLLLSSPPSSPLSILTVLQDGWKIKSSSGSLDEKKDGRRGQGNKVSGQADGERKKERKREMEERRGREVEDKRGHSNQYSYFVRLSVCVFVCLAFQPCPSTIISLSPSR